MDSHRGAFVAEARQGVTDLNNALLALEADPEDDEAMDDVFRVAHTLKGNAAAMGFEDVSSFGHALEDLLDAIRRGERTVTPEVMDLLFEGVDIVEAMVAEIADGGDVVTDPSDVERRLREMEERGMLSEGGGDVDAPRDDENADAAGSGDESVDEYDPGTDPTSAVSPLPESAAELDGAALVHTEVTIGETSMPGVDATFVMQALETFDGYATDPDPATLEAGKYDGGFDALVAADDPAVVVDGLEALTQVEAVEAVLVDDRPSGNGETTDEERPSGNEGTTDEDDGAGDSGDSGDGSAGSAAARDRITSIRVDVDQVDELYGLVEQLVTSRIKLRRELEEADVESDTLDELDKLASSLQDTAMDMRLIPFSQVSDSFPRLVRDVARDVDKEVTFGVEGGDVELDRTILTEMRDPLVHVLRNAVDHGIEPPGEREAAGKDPIGNVRLTAERDRDHVVIEVADDGGGLDPDSLREKAVREGIESREAVEMMSDEEAYDLVFRPGFSTAEEVTDVSGRGVGMDVVRTTARDLDGSVSITSDPGGGTTVRFRLPVTVAIVKVMFVDVGGTEYGIPIKSIAEVARADDVETVHGDEVVRHEGDLYPVIRLEERLETTPDDVRDAPVAASDGGSAVADAEAVATTAESATTDSDSTTTSAGSAADGMIIRIREETRQVALRCDAVLDQEEVVVKPLDGPLSGTPGLSGTAVLGDGDVVAVLDVVSL